MLAVQRVPSSSPTWLVAIGRGRSSRGGAWGCPFRLSTMATLPGVLCSAPRHFQPTRVHVRPTRQRPANYFPRHDHLPPNINEYQPAGTTMATAPSSATPTTAVAPVPLATAQDAVTTAAATATTTSSSSGAPPPLLVVPDAFAQVEPNVYRSGMPTAAHIPYLRTLHLKSVLVLSPDLPPRAVLAFLDEQKIELIHLGQPHAWRSTLSTASTLSSAAASSSPPATWRPVPEELIKEALELALDAPRTHPVLVCCTTGVHETGVLVACLRRMQRWNFNSIVAEFRAFSFPSARAMAEQFVELFDDSLVTLPPPERLPPGWGAYLVGARPMSGVKTKGEA
ncbi:hypothetical protein AMAG_13597 [Allomyces macrogynus ATCC 38327]|uniref:Tyrosine specific protein phosphatases domain-containing protein n=1 Tax=Allomyces macrogynus (strain ATCC 38327) TaxID=578462 RepID=A0A0L0T3E5_ALLM3|nr:hypothetical protein AMAG_13597 [Allomyces macrogynus ATCC 38327]|eukprot:KNE69205.1 hypothetical protein AMAG_13597 [Allomyces macrogynus ATCC 38327]